MSTSGAALRLGMVTVEPHGRPWAEVLARMPEVKMSWAWDYDLDRARGYAAHYGIPNVATDVEQLLGQVDAVLIGGGRRMPGENGVWGEQKDDHLLLARPFLKAGLPVLVDKPFADSVEDAVEMVQLARQHGALLMSCSAMRYDSAVIALKEQIADGGLGQVAGAACMIGTGTTTLKWYVIHMLEGLHYALGPGLESVYALPGQVPLVPGKEGLAKAYGLVLRWRSGPVATLLMVCDETDAAQTTEQARRQPRILWPTASIVPPYLPLHYSLRVYGDMNWADVRPVGKGCYGRKLAAFLKMIATGQEAIPLEHSLEITEALMAAERSIASQKLEMLRPVEELLALKLPA
jgi:predicted dehydrogenase